MKANELRIGNWVFDDEGKPSRIEALWSKAWRDNDGGDSEHFGLSINGEIGWLSPIVTGIPLTPEILEKCGFEKEEDGDGGYYHELLSGNGQLFVEGDKKGYTDVFLDLNETVRVRYLHQLQNLYWCLCGEELKVNM